jgi:hypothetical protein
MRLSVIKAIHDIADKKFKEMLIAGFFPKVRYEETVTKNEDGTEHKWHSYSLFEYSEVWTTFTKFLDEQMKKSLDPKLGIFTRKHSASFLAKVQKIVDGITVENVENQTTRFHGFGDSVMEYATENIINKGL